MVSPQLGDGMPSEDQLWHLGTETNTLSLTENCEGAVGCQPRLLHSHMGCLQPEVGLPKESDGELMASLKCTAKGGRSSAWLGFSIVFS